MNKNLAGEMVHFLNVQTIYRVASPGSRNIHTDMSDAPVDLSEIGGKLGWLRAQSLGDLLLAPLEGVEEGTLPDAAPVEALHQRLQLRRF